MKTTQLLSFILTLAVLTSCKHDKTEEYKQLILGDWKEYRDANSDEPPPPPEVNLLLKRGYGFEPDGVLHYRQGILRYAKQEDADCISKSIYLGTKSKYTIENDSLKSLKLSDGEWMSCRIASLSTDTLILSFDNDSIVKKYVKCKYTIDSTLTFDRIIVSSSVSSSNYPINDIMICQNGNVVYNGTCHNSINGLFCSKINESVYYSIENNFKKAGIKQLETQYYSEYNEGISVTFIKDNKIFKTIKDYGKQSPAEFLWAYSSTSYLYQQLELDTIPTFLDLSEVAEMRMIALHDKDNKSCSLTNSESFYLKNLLFESTLCDTNFSPLYNVTTYFSTIPIVTDGRYYKVFLDNDSHITFDIGHNFITGNNLQNKFEKMSIYEDIHLNNM